jgi:hypothetical protein
MGAEPTILILTPVKNAARYLQRYVEGLLSLTHPHDRISIGILEGDSTDSTYTQCDGVVFPPFPYGLENTKIRHDNHWRGEIETEGLAMMAADAGVQCWGMPRLEIRHHR